MAYTKNTWQSGDVITAEKLNNIENGINNATGYEFTKLKVVLFEGEVTTVSNGTFALSSIPLNITLSADTLYITFNGTEYTCEKVSTTSGFCYGDFEDGGFIFSELPFMITGYNNPPQLFTENGGTYSLKIEVLEDQAITTHEFDVAVNTVINTRPPEINIIEVYYDSYYNTKRINKTYEELNEIFNNHTPIIIVHNNQYTYTATLAPYQGGAFALYWTTINKSSSTSIKILNYMLTIDSENNLGGSIDTINVS